MNDNVFTTMSFELKVLGYDIPSNELSKYYLNGVFYLSDFVIYNQNVNLWPINSFAHFKKINIGFFSVMESPSMISAIEVLIRNNIENLKGVEVVYFQNNISVNILDSVLQFQNLKELELSYFDYDTLPVRTKQMLLEHKSQGCIMTGIIIPD